jgi:hypothetical protein
MLNDEAKKLANWLLELNWEFEVYRDEENNRDYKLYFVLYNSWRDINLEDENECRKAYDELIEETGYMAYDQPDYNDVIEAAGATDATGATDKTSKF